MEGGGGPISSTGSGTTFLAKYDPAGNPLWSKPVGGSGDGTSVVFDAAGNIILGGHLGTSGLGTLDGVGFIAKLDPDGNVLWAKGADYTLGGDYVRTVDVAVDPAGNVYVTADCDGTVDVGGGPLTCQGVSHNLVLKLDPDGNHVWSKVLYLPGDGQDDQYGKAL